MSQVNDQCNYEMAWLKSAQELQIILATFTELQKSNKYYETHAEGRKKIYQS